VVPVTREDVLRLATHTGLEPHAFVELCSASDVDIDGEPESLADVPEGLRLAVLARREGACIFLGSETDGRRGCTVHSARPRSCRAYPFDRPSEHGSVVGLHPEALGPPEAGQLRVLQDPSERLHWAEVVRQRDVELHDHAAWLATWNRRQRLRRLLGKRRLPSAEFVRKLGMPRTTEGVHASSGIGSDDAAHGVDVAPAEQVDVHE